MTAAPSSPTVTGGASSLPLFLAHAVELESEAALRYDELADSMEAHNNWQVAALFRDMARYSRLHRDEVMGIAAAHGPLPKVAPWEFQWTGTAESPEAAAFDGAHYLMTPHHALCPALACEEARHAYYAAVAEQTAVAEVARLARDFAAEESHHVVLVRQWLERFPAPDAGWDDDPDPPNTAE